LQRVSEEKRETRLQRLLRRRRNKRLATAAILLVAVPLLGWFLWQYGIPGQDLFGDGVGSVRPPAGPADFAGEPATAETPGAESASLPHAGTAPAAAAPALPGLDESDAFVRRATAALARHPEMARWLATDDLVRRFVAAVDNVAEGRSPRRHLEFLSPPGSFLVVGDVEGMDPLLADPINDRRYDAVVSAIEAVDPDDSSRLYASLAPLLEEAYVDLGYPDASFDDRLKDAAYELLATPILPDPPQLIPQVARFEYADPVLENLSDAQKHLLRMGPRNVDRLQRKLREMLRAIDPSWNPPPMQVYRTPSPNDAANANRVDE
jgi:hypothetical protein